jgi:hypothetical protein
METSNKLTGEQLSLWTLSAVDIPVNHLVQQASDKEQTTQDTCGHGLEQPLASYDPDTQSWRMSEDISLWGDHKLLESLPKSGMTQNGVLYQQPEWAHHIDASESLSWPTPRNCTAMAATITPESVWNPKRFPNLETVVGRRLWPTPTANMSFNPNAEWVNGRRQEGPRGIGMTLKDAVGSGQLNPTWVEWLMGFPTGWTDLED